MKTALTAITVCVAYSKKCGNVDSTVLRDGMLSGDDSGYPYGGANKGAENHSGSAHFPPMNRG